jgi:hypothetical protein
MPEPVISTWDIKYVLAPDGETTLTRRVDVVDTVPIAGHGPSIGQMHKALREALAAEDPQVTDLPHQAIVIVRAKAAEDEPTH